MGSIRLGVGTEWLLDGRAFRIVRQLSLDRFIAVDRAFNVERPFSAQEVLSLYGQGLLRFSSPSDKPAGADLVDAKPMIVDDLSPSDRQEVARRWRAIEPLTELGRTPVRNDFVVRARELAQHGHAYSVRSLQRFFRVWLGAGGDRLALVPKTTHCGARGKARSSGLLGSSSQLRQLADEAIVSVYLTTARRPIAAVSRRVLEDLQRRNARLPAAQTIPIPRESVLQRALSRRIAQIDPWEVDRARWGRRIADRRHAPTTRQQLATRILQRVEIDHSPLKVVVGNNAGPIGQPWLTVLIDYHSRMITGFCLGFEPPSYAVIMEALRIAILPKTQVMEKYPKVQHAWPCFGIPEKLVCDRGADLTSKDLEQAAFQLGMELDFAPPRTPHFKGTVESCFDTLNDQLLASLPGRTFRSWERRADYNPDDGPLMPYEALVEIIHIHLIDVYAHSRHPTIGKTRFEVWQDSAAELPPCLPASPDDLVVLLAKRVERNLSARGIEVGGMFYLSDELMALRAELAAHNLNAERMLVRYNPWDLGQVWVLNPLDKRYLKADAVDSALRGLTEYQWRVLKRAVRERFDDPDHLLSLAASRNAIRDVVEATMTKPSRKRRLRAARYLQEHPEKRTSENPGIDSEVDWHSIDDTSVDGTSGSSPPLSTTETERSPKAVPVPSDPPPDPDPSPVNIEDWEVST